MTVEWEKVVVHVVAIGGVVAAIAAALAPILVAVINNRHHEDDEDEEETPAPVMGMPVPVDHGADVPALLNERIRSLTAERDAKIVESALLSTQLNAAYVGWRQTQSALDQANRNLVGAGLLPVTPPAP